MSGHTVFLRYSEDNQSSGTIRHSHDSLGDPLKRIPVAFRKLLLEFEVLILGTPKACQFLNGLGGQFTGWHPEDIRKHFGHLPQSGMFPCFLTGFSSCFDFRSSSERISIGRVARASITSSMKPRAAAL